MTQRLNPGLTFEAVARTDVGCRRQLNEDAVLCRPDLRLWAVADGMGGHQRGEVASALIVSSLEQAPLGEELAERVLNLRLALTGANAELVRMATEGAGPRPGTIGATAVVLTIAGGRFACLWAGDSRAYGLRAGGLTQLTRDHSLVQHLVDAGELDPAQAEAHPNAHVVTRAVGADANLALDIVEGEIAAGDAFLLASDGLTRVVSADEIAAGLRGADLTEAADGLLSLALARGAPDNVSLVLVRALDRAARG